MELKLLEDFLCVNEVRNFSKAAKIRNVTQSALSKRIRTLEDWMGAQLIDRSSYPVTLTAEGRAMVAQARDLVSQFNGMRSGVRRLASPVKNAVLLGSLHTLRLTTMPDWRTAILPQTGDFQVELTGNHIAYGQTLRQFRNGESDLLLTYSHPAVADGLTDDLFDSVLIAPERVIPVSSADTHGQPLHRLDAGAFVNYLSYGTSSFFARLLAWMLSEQPLSLNVTASNAMSVGLLSLVEVGCGVAWIPERLMRDQLASGTVVPAGGPEWTIHCDIRLFRPRAPIRPLAEQIWNASKDLMPLRDRALTDPGGFRVGHATDHSLMR